MHGEALFVGRADARPHDARRAGFSCPRLSQPDETLPSVVDLVAMLTARGVPVVAAGPAAGHGSLSLPFHEGLESLHYADRADAELLSAGRAARSRARPRPRRAAAPEEGHGDGMIALAIVCHADLRRRAGCAKARLSSIANGRVLRSRRGQMQFPPARPPPGRRGCSRPASSTCR